MRVVVAPDSFKGSVSAREAAKAISEGIMRVWPDAECIRIPIADGGEGTVDAILEGAGGELRRVRVSDPLGRMVESTFGMLPDGRTAVIEMAAASGLPLLSPEERNPLITSTRGTGELVKAALDAGATGIIIGIGGSATNDGGAGFAQALGARFIDQSGRELPPGGAALVDLAHIDASGLDPRLGKAEIMVACDVANPLTGPEGASAVYGPQKGATPDMVRILDAALSRYAEIVKRDLGMDIAGIPGSGAAGGLGGGLMAFAGALMRPGIGLVLDTVGFAAKVAGADLVITGEGSLDSQTVYGKAPTGVAKAAKAAKPGIPVVALAGNLGPGSEAVYSHAIDALSTTVPGPVTVADAMGAGARYIADAAERVARLMAMGATLGLG